MVKLICTFGAVVCFAMALHDFKVSHPWMLYDLMMATGLTFFALKEPKRR
jgi:hypothetical protein